VFSQLWPAFVVDAAWEILLANEPTALWFEGLAIEGNFVRWMLCHPAARMQIGEWEAVAQRMLNQLTAQAARLPEYDGVKTTIREILDQSELARRWWASEPGVWLHDDGNRRTILLPGATEPTLAEIVSTNPFRDGQLRAFTIVPLSGYVPAGCRDLVEAARAVA
jgi:MmyB-like transcription regulator ligand binding domain